MPAGLASFILETSTNPGTGSFTLNGPMPNRLTWASAFASGAPVYYFADDGTQAEWGIGTFTAGSPNTIARSTVIRTTANSAQPLNFTGTVNVYNEVPGTLLPTLEPDGRLLLGTGKNDPVRLESGFSLTRQAFGDASNIGNNSDAAMFQLSAVYFQATSPRVSVDLTFNAFLDGAHYTVQASDIATVKGRVTLRDGGNTADIDHLDKTADVVPNRAGNIFVPYSYSQLTPGTTYLLVFAASLLGVNNQAIRFATSLAGVRVMTL